MWHAHEVLIVPLAHTAPLFPFRIFANHQMTDSLTHEQVNDATGCPMQVVIDLARAVGRESFESMGRVALMLTQVAL